MMDRLAPAGITIALQPDADGECAENLRLALRGALGHPVEIDLGRVPYLTSSALAVLARFRRESGGEPIVLRRANALVFRTLQVVGFNKSFTIESQAS